MNELYYRLFASTAVAMIVSLIAVSWVRRWALARQLVDMPGERRSHVRPTPRGGGIGIALGILAGWITWLIGGGQPDPSVVALLLSGGMVAVLGFVDDLRGGLPVSLRLGVQLLAAGLLVVAVQQNAFLQAGGGEQALAMLPGPLWVVLAGLALLALTNIYNFMDGIDGLAGGQAIIAAAAWFCLTLNHHLPALALVVAVIAAAAAGFLAFNWPPAKIFMGDVGSTLLGFLFAGLSVITSVREPQLALAGCLALAPFIVDASVTMLLRALRRENLFAAHRSHFYQRLVIAGWSHRRVTLLYLGLSLAGAIAAIAWQGEQVMNP